MRWSSLYWREFGCRWKGLLVMTVPWLLGNLHNVPHRVLLLNPALDFPVPLSSASLEETLRIPVLPHNHAHCFSPSPFSDVFLTSGKFLLSFVFFRTALSSSFSSFLNLLIQFFFWKISKVHETQNAVINNQKNCFLFSQGGRRELSIQHLQGSKGGIVTFNSSSASGKVSQMDPLYFLIKMSYWQYSMWKNWEAWENK